MSTTDAGASPVERWVMQHTRGPWYARCADEWKTLEGRHVQWGRFDISAGSPNGQEEHYYRIASVSNVNNSHQNQANAKLIAAAPDMAEALKVARAYIARYGYTGEQLRIIDAALEKAGIGAA